MNINQSGQTIIGNQTNCESVTITGSSEGATINGVKYPGGNISINNGKVFINGVEQDGTLSNCQKIEVIIKGDIESLETKNGNVTAAYCGSVRTGNGNVSCSGHISGDVTTKLGNVNCGEVRGDVTTKLGSISRR